VLDQRSIVLRTMGSNTAIEARFEGSQNRECWKGRFAE
jgi:hypothetical protein